MSAPRRFLLAGGSGFIGTHVAHGLITRGHAVTVLSRGRRDAVPGATMLTADRNDPQAVAALLDGRHFDLTVDFLAYDAPDLEWLADRPAATLGRLVMISTGQVYLVGEGAVPPYIEAEAERPAIAEPAADAEDHLPWSYGVGKRRAEAALSRLGADRGLPVTALRLPSIQGEADGSLRLWAYLERMLDGGPLLLPDGGRRPTRFLDVRDIAPVIERLLEGPPPRAFAYNLAPPGILTLREFLERVAAAAGLRPRFVEAAWDRCRDAGLDDRFAPYAGPWASVLDPARATAELGFAGTGPDGYLPRVVRWHLENRPGESHPGYASRARELELAERLEGAAR